MQSPRGPTGVEPPRRAHDRGDAIRRVYVLSVLGLSVLGPVRAEGHGHGVDDLHRAHQHRVRLDAELGLTDVGSARDIRKASQGPPRAGRWRDHASRRGQWTRSLVRATVEISNRAANSATWAPAATAFATAARQPLRGGGPSHVSRVTAGTEGCGRLHRGDSPGRHGCWW